MRVSDCPLSPGGGSRFGGVPNHSVLVPTAASIPCSAFKSSWGNPRIEWKFQKGSTLVLFYYGGELTGTPPPSPRCPRGVPNTCQRHIPLSPQSRTGTG